MTRAQIMFVDDDPHTLASLRRSLRAKSHDWEMTFAAGAAEAAALFRNQPYDVVISDLAMPGMNGIELVLALRKISDRSRYILLTGTADLDKAVAAINQARVFRFFTKPCATDLLIDGIESALADIEADGARDAEAAQRALPPLSASIGLAALNRVAFGILVVNGSARVLLTNRTGAEILSERDGLSLSASEVLRAATPAATNHLHKLIRAAGKELSDEAANGLALERPSGKRPLSVLLCGTPEAKLEEHGPLTVLFLSDPDRQPLPDADTILKLFDLTPSESRLAAALTSGLKLEVAAEHCELTVSTARTYLKQIFSKTGARRQSELVKLILTSPALAP